MAKNELDELIEQSEAAIEKGEDLSEIDADHHHKVKDEHSTKKEKVEIEIRKAKFGEKKESVIEEANDEAGVEEVKKEKTEKREEKPKAKKIKKGKAKVRSKKYQNAKALVDVNKKYELEEALELVKKTSMTKFPGSVEVHVRMLGKNGKPEQVRGLIKYPFSTGKKVDVVILNEKIIEEISTTSKAPADIYLSTPDLMPKVAKLAKILGPKGKMPNPKAGTVSATPEKTKADLEGGQMEYKTDSYGIIHQAIGKVSAKEDELNQNYKALLAVMPQEKIVSINLCATMGPAIKVQK